MMDLILSPFRRVRTRARSTLSTTSIDLAGRGLFWPLAALAAAAAVILSVMLWKPLASLLYDVSLWVFAGMLVTSSLIMLVKRTSLWAVVWQWCVIYLVTGVPTHIWAESLGLGGAQELAFWVVLFGAAAFAAGSLLGLSKRTDLLMDATAWSIIGGYGIGLAAFIGVHLTTQPPKPGDWWMAPAFSAGALVFSLLFMRRPAPAARVQAAPPTRYGYPRRGRTL